MQAECKRKNDELRKILTFRQKTTAKVYPATPIPSRSRSRTQKTVTKLLPYMKGPVLTQTAQLCTPLSSFTPTTKKFKTLVKMHELGKNEAFKAVPIQPPYPIHDEDISNIFDKCMSQLEKFPQKLIECNNLTDSICIRSGFGSIIRMKGRLFEVFQKERLHE